MKRGIVAEQVFLCIYVTLYCIVTASYAMTIWYNWENFYLVARHPRVLWIDLALTAFIIVSYAIVQSAADRQHPITPHFTHFVTFIGMYVIAVEGASSCPFTCSMSTRLVVVFSTDLRAKYGWYWTRQRMLWMIHGCFCLAVLLWVASLFMSQRPLVLGFMIVITCVLLGLIVMVRKGKVNDQLGIMAEQRRLLYCIIFWFIVVLPLLSNPHIFPASTSRTLLTWLLIFLVSCETVIVHIIPSVKHKYDPISSLRRYHDDDTRSRRVRPEVRRSTGAGSTATNRASSGIGATANQFELLPAYNDELIELLQDASLRFLCAENMLFLLAVNDLQNQEDSGQAETTKLLEIANSILLRYVKQGSEYEVNLSSSQVQRCFAAFADVQSAIRAGTPPGKPVGGGVNINSATQNGTLGLREDAGLEAVESGVKVGHVFKEAFREIEKMLAQNIMPYVESQKEYQQLLSRHYLQTLDQSNT